MSSDTNLAEWEVVAKAGLEAFDKWWAAEGHVTVQGNRFLNEHVWYNAWLIAHGFVSKPGYGWERVS